MKKLFNYLLVLLCGLCLSGCNQPENKTIILNTPSQIELVCVGDTKNIATELTIDGVLSNNYFYTIADPSIIDIKDDLVTGLNAGTTFVTVTCRANHSINKTISVTVLDTPMLSAHFIDVGQGDATFIELPNGKTLMIDAGLGLYGGENSWTNIQKTIDDAGHTKIDYLVITHNHGDHYGAVPNLVRKYQVDTVYINGSTRTNPEYYNVTSAIYENAQHVVIAKIGDYLFNEFDLSAQVVATRQVENETDADGNPNYNSIMIRLAYKNVSYMFTGDAGYREGDAEDLAINSGLILDSDIIKVGHHGSTYSSGTLFLAKVSPKIAVITTSKETETGHPHQSALNRLSNYCKEIYQSKDNGTIIIKTDGNKIIIQTEK